MKLTYSRVIDEYLKVVLYDDRIICFYTIPPIGPIYYITSDAVFNSEHDPPFYYIFSFYCTHQRTQLPIKTELSRFVEGITEFIISDEALFIGPLMISLDFDSGLLTAQTR